MPHELSDVTDSLATSATATATVPPFRVLVVEDNADLAFGLRRTLEAQQYAVEIVDDGARVLPAVSRFVPDLLILDLMLPGRDGFTVLEQLRAAGHLMPVLILSARSEETDKVRGFRAGADDFVTKPFGVQELVERVAALLRRAVSRTPHGESARLHIGDVELDVAARRATRHGEVVPLAPMEFDLLVALMRRPRVALSRAVLLRDVWGHAPDIQTRTVDLHIAELRRKIERVPSQPRHIITVFKTGYRFEP